MTATVCCIHCDEPLPDIIDGRYVDPEGIQWCRDGGEHKPVLTVADIAQLAAEDAEGRYEDFDLMDGSYDRG